MWIKGLRYLATEIDSERLKINGFYSDWTIADFPYHTVFYGIVMIYPYLPGLIPVCSKGFPHLSV